MILAILVRPLGLHAPKDFYIIWISILLNMSSPDEGYSRNALCTLNYISTYLLLIYKNDKNNDTDRSK
jgi:hypothetical protein